MKVAITSTGNTLESNLDSRFGRCSYFVIFDTESHSLEFIPNPNKDMIEGAGPASVLLIVNKGATKVISGEFGAKVKSLFDSYKIQLIVMPDLQKRVTDIIDLLSR